MIISYPNYNSLITSAYQEAQAGYPATRPVIEMTIPSALDPTLAPVGHHVVQFFVQYAPYHLKEGEQQLQQQQQQQLLLLQKNCVSYSTDIHLDNHEQISMILYNAVKPFITLSNHPSIIITNSDGDREDESFKQAFANRIFDIVEEFCPGFQASVLHRDVLSPLDLERIFGLPGGSISHGALSLNQLGYSRPVAGNAFPWVVSLYNPFGHFFFF